MAVWVYLWTGERVTGPLTVEEYRRLEPTLGPETLVWDLQEGWIPIWRVFDAPDGTQTGWLHADAETPPAPPPPPQQDPAITGDRDQPTVLDDQASDIGPEREAPATGTRRIGLLAALVAGAVVAGCLIVVWITRSGGSEPTATDQTGGDAAGASQSPSSSTSEAEAGTTLQGHWMGSMNSGRYRYEMTMREKPSGQLNATMTQTDVSTGQSGTEFLTGRRTDDGLLLQGRRWSRDSPAGWSLDRIGAKVAQSPKGWRMSGTYTCPTCNSEADIQGRMTASGAYLCRPFDDAVWGATQIAADVPCRDAYAVIRAVGVPDRSKDTLTVEARGNPYSCEKLPWQETEIGIPLPKLESEVECEGSAPEAGVRYRLYFWVGE